MYASIYDLYRMELKRKVKADGSNIVDVRSKAEYIMGHVKGSTNIPLQQVPDRIQEISAIGEPLILCCASGGRSGQATEFLKAQGLNEVYNGGGWREVRQALE